ncbi:MAG: right-handed parallel beta-helix repeat-containing protein, partial [Deltaproteobacteria bacterium]|nr:right-handed parallel beta-helix repeat-containing protein [Deltaproteobacteria bacterium]
DAGETTTVDIEAVRIVGSHTGMRIGPGATVSLSDSTITGSAVHGLTGAEATAITLTRSVIADSGGPGMWIKCADGCNCPQKPNVSLDRVLVRGNRLVSAAFVGVQATLNLVDITNSLEFGFERGGGLLVRGCSDVTATGVTVSTASSYGIFVDSSSATLGGGLGEAGIIIIDSMPGVWIQRIGSAAEEPDQTVVLDGVEVSDCRQAGMGFDHEAQGIIIIDSKVANTASASAPVEPVAGGTQAAVGLGVVWKRMSAVSIDGLSVSGSSGHGILIDGPVAAGSTMANITLDGDDAAQGVAQQQVDTQDEAPSVGANAPSVEQHSDKIADVPVGLELPVEP